MLSEPLSRPAIRWLLLVVLYLLVAAASFSGYFSKWQFRDLEPKFALPGILDGTAQRPFVYRQLLPAIANGVERALPAWAVERLQTRLADVDNLYHHNPIAFFNPNATDVRNPQYALRYYAVYALSFTTLLLAIFVLRAVCIDMQANRIAANLAPLAFAAILPLTMTEGGYYYDLPELLFMALAAWLAARGQVLWLIVMTALATLNKESFLFFVLTLFPFLRNRLSVRTTVSVQLLLLVVAGVVNGVVKLKYTHNPGGMVEFHLMDNIRFLTRPWNYVRFEYNYGVMTTKGFNLINLFVVAVLVRAAWSKLSPVVRQHLKIATLINVPLYLALGFEDELRNFSMLYVGFVVILCVNIATCLDSSYQERAGQQPA